MNSFKIGLFHEKKKRKNFHDCTLPLARNKFAEKNNLFLLLLELPCAGTVFDFENGLSGWTFTGTAFNNQPTYGDNLTARNRGQPSNHTGDWWIGGYENRPSPWHPAGGVQGDGPTGSLTSPSFVIGGNSFKFLIGGGCNMGLVRAELVVEGNVVLQETGDCHESMTEKVWDVSGYIGRRAQLRLVDHTSASWGHINFDQFKEISP